MLRRLALTTITLLATSAVAHADPITLAPTELDRLSAGGTVVLRFGQHYQGIVVQRVGRRLWRALQRYLERAGADGAAGLVLPPAQAARLGLGEEWRQVVVVGPNGQSVAIAGAIGEQTTVTAQVSGSGATSSASSRSTSSSSR